MVREPKPLKIFLDGFFSFVQIAQRLHVSPTLISKWCSGAQVPRRNNPTLARLVGELVRCDAELQDPLLAARVREIDPGWDAASEGLPDAMCRLVSTRDEKARPRRKSMAPRHPGDPWREAASLARGLPAGAYVTPMIVYPGLVAHRHALLALCDRLQQYETPKLYLFFRDRMEWFDGDAELLAELQAHFARLVWKGGHVSIISGVNYTNELNALLGEAAYPLHLTGRFKNYYYDDSLPASELRILAYGTGARKKGKAEEAVLSGISRSSDSTPSGQYFSLNLDPLVTRHMAALWNSLYMRSFQPAHYDFFNNIGEFFSDADKPYYRYQNCYFFAEDPAVALIDREELHHYTGRSPADIDRLARLLFPVSVGPMDMDPEGKFYHVLCYDTLRDIMLRRITYSPALSKILGRRFYIKCSWMQKLLGNAVRRLRAMPGYQIALLPRRDMKENGISFIALGQAAMLAWNEKLESVATKHDKSISVFNRRCADRWKAIPREYRDKDRVEKMLLELVGLCTY